MWVIPEDKKEEMIEISGRFVLRDAIIPEDFFEKNPPEIYKIWQKDIRMVKVPSNGEFWKITISGEKLDFVLENEVIFE